MKIRLPRALMSPVTLVAICLLSLIAFTFQPQTVYAQGYNYGYSSSSGNFNFGTMASFRSTPSSGSLSAGGGSFDFFGCSFSLSQFIQANFNLPSSFEEIKQALTTRLVKYFITNMTILPQLQAAIQDFTQKLGIDLRVAKEACNLSSLGRRQAETFAQCCQRVYSGDRYSECMQRKGSAGDDCAAQTSKEVNSVMTNACKSVTEGTRSLFCPTQTGNTCGIMNMLPRMRLTCNNQTITVGGENIAPPVTGGSMATAAGMFGNSVMGKAETVFNQARAAGATNDQIKLIAEEAVRLARANDCGAAVEPTDEDETTKEIRRRFNCRNADPMFLPRCMAKAAKAKGFTSVTDPTMTASDDIKPSQIMSAVGGDYASQAAADAPATAKLLQTAIVCTINHGNVNVVDPHVLAKLIMASDPSLREGGRNALLKELECTTMKEFIPFLEEQVQGAYMKASSADQIKASPNQADSDFKASAASKSIIQPALRKMERDFKNMLRMINSQCEGGKAGAAILSKLDQIEQGGKPMVILPEGE